MNKTGLFLVSVLFGMTLASCGGGGGGQASITPMLENSIPSSSSISILVL
jgi:hypothetical protein